MKFKLIFLILLFIHFPSLCNSQQIDNISKYRNQLIEIEEKKEALKEQKNNLLKIYITLYIKKFYKNDIFEIFRNPDYSLILDEEEKFKFLEKALKKKIIALKEEEKSLDISYHKILKTLEKIENLKIQKISQKIYAVNPLDGNPINPGTHILEVKKPTSVIAPITGVVKGISYKSDDNISIIIENPKCRASISGLDEVDLNLGDHVLIKRTIGSVNKPKNLSFSVICEGISPVNH